MLASLSKKKIFIILADGEKATCASSQNGCTPKKKILFLQILTVFGEHEKEQKIMLFFRRNNFDETFLGESFSRKVS
jgi:hypothetical protein